MTFNIPYSFVPGTKAKANEVNANFIAVIDELDKINSDIETLNSSVATKADLDLANLDEAGQSTLDNKADKTELDGVWKSKNSYIAQNVTVTANYNKTFDLSSLLPEDDNTYEIIIGAIIRTGSESNNCLAIIATTQLCNGVFLGRAVTRINNYNDIDSCNCTIPIGPDRSLTIRTGSETNANSYPNSCSFKLCGYRKVR